MKANFKINLFKMKAAEEAAAASAVDENPSPPVEGSGASLAFEQ